MRILILNASPRKTGNISSMVSTMADEARQNGAEIDIINVNSLNVRPCIACMSTSVSCLRMTHSVCSA